MKKHLFIVAILLLCGVAYGQVVNPPDVAGEIGSAVTNIAGQAWSNTNVIYVTKHGDETSDGLSVYSAVASVTNGIALASNLVDQTGQRWSVLVLDAATYTNELDIAEGIQVDMGLSTLEGTVQMQNYTRFVAPRLISTATGGAEAITKTSAGDSNTCEVVVGEIILTEDGDGLRSAKGDMILDVGVIYGTNGNLLDQDVGHLYGRIDELRVAGSGFAITGDNSGDIALDIGRMVVGAGGHGAFVRDSTGDIALNIGEISADSEALRVTNNANLYVVCGKMDGEMIDVGGNLAVICPRQLNGGADDVPMKVLGDASFSGAITSGVFHGVYRGTGTGIVGLTAETLQATLSAGNTSDVGIALMTDDDGTVGRAALAVGDSCSVDSHCVGIGNTVTLGNGSTNSLGVGNQSGGLGATNSFAAGWNVGVITQEECFAFGRDLYLSVHSNVFGVNLWDRDPGLAYITASNHHQFFVRAKGGADFWVGPGEDLRLNGNAVLTNVPVANETQDLSSVLAQGAIASTDIDMSTYAIFGTGLVGKTGYDLFLRSGDATGPSDYARDIHLKVPDNGPSSGDDGGSIYLTPGTAGGPSFTNGLVVVQGVQTNTTNVFISGELLVNLDQTNNGDLRVGGDLHVGGTIYTPGSTLVIGSETVTADNVADFKAETNRYHNVVSRAAIQPMDQNLWQTACVATASVYVTGWYEVEAGGRYNTQYYSVPPHLWTNRMARNGVQVGEVLKDSTIDVDFWFSDPHGPVKMKFTSGIPETISYEWWNITAAPVKTVAVEKAYVTITGPLTVE